MKKRMLSAILAMSMVMGMSSVTAFADDFDKLDDANGASFEATGSAEDLPTINVTVPTSGEITLDPFNMNQLGQIASADFKIINNSNVPLSVTVKSAKAEGTGVEIVAKAATDTSKWAVVNMNVTDGIGKTTKKVLSTTEQDIAVATAMAPKGGIVKYSYDGTTAITPETAWAESDSIKVSNTFAFTMNSYTTYSVAKAITCSMTATSVEAESAAADVDALIATFPTTVIGDSKIEIPVTWTCGADNADYKDDVAGDYTFTAVVADADIYKVGETVTMPTIKVTVTAKSTT